MSPFLKRLSDCTLAAGTLILAMATAPTLPSTDGATLTIQGTTVHGTEVTVTVANPSRQPRSGTLRVQVFSSAGVLDLTAHVTVGAGESVCVPMLSPSPVATVIPLGVVLDDGVPF